VYVSNRGHDSIAVLQADPGTGVLTWVETVSTGGSWPRNFVVSPDGRFLLTANQRSRSVVVFSVDPDTGIPRETGARFEVDQPACLKFV
jgi:6-phosphogluconolactonase